MARSYIKPRRKRKSIPQNRLDAKKKIRLDRWNKEKNPVKFYKNAMLDTKREYGISKLQMEFLIFIYDEGSFSLDLIYNNDYFRCSDAFRKNGFKDLIEKNMVFLFRERNGFMRHKKLFRITIYAKGIVKKFYKRLNREIE